MSGFFIWIPMYYRIDNIIIDLTKITALLINMEKSIIEINLHGGIGITLRNDDNDIQSLIENFDDIWKNLERINKINSESHTIKLIESGMIECDEPLK